ncbi:MAG: hypothetical protein E7773_03125 [Sphingomonas sp.]|uniref:hypothetical protein n=1 Tax=Sphingomonas sp. TaxID=28214 RepID=UPI00120907E1|nr:hypothetical protein [Sphingomonas sp.]THD37982.1 MAG: hypothetical protein E7773_03125 [Sphingomonas sp.]
MRILVPALALTALALTGCAMSPAETARAQANAEATRAALGQQLAGLHATGTDDCLDTFRTNSASLKAYGPTLVYRVSNGLVYVNDTAGGCEAIEHGDYLVTRSNSGRLCRGDIGQTFSAGSHIPTGSCALGSFTTYRK